MLHSSGSRISSAALAAIVAAGLVAIPLERNSSSTMTQQVQFQAVLLSAVTNTSALDAVSPAGSQSGSLGNGTSAEIQATPSAASAVDDALGPLAPLARIANILVLPIWYLAFPITFPLTGLVLSASSPNNPALGIATLFGFLGGPLGVLEFLIPTASSVPSVNSSAAQPADGPRTSTESSVEPVSSVGVEVLAAAKAIPAAAETTEENPWETPLGQVLIALNFLVLPLWFLATPITLPFSMLAAASQLPDTDSPLNSLLFLAATGIAFLTGPLGALSLLTRADPTPAAAVRASAASSMDAAIEPNEEVAPDAAPSANEVGSDIRRTASAPTPVRGRVTGLPANERPGSAAALRVAADRVIDSEADESAQAVATDGTGSAESSAAKDGRGSAKANKGLRNR